MIKAGNPSVRNVESFVLTTVSPACVDLSFSLYAIRRAVRLSFGQALSRLLVLLVRMLFAVYAVRGSRFFMDVAASCTKIIAALTKISPTIAAEKLPAAS